MVYTAQSYNVLVTGGAGYVGSVCCAELLRQGHQVTVIDDLSTGHRDAVPEDAEFIRCDIRDARHVRAVLAAKKFDAIFHFAAKALVPDSITDPAPFYQVNLIGATTLIDAAREARIGRFLFSSTAAVYGNPLQIPITEDHPKSPLNSYGESKLAFERLLERYAGAYGISVCTFRYFNVVGATESHGERHEPETHIVPLLLDAALGIREHFTVYGHNYPTPDGTCIRDYIHVLDVAKAHTMSLATLGSPGFRVYNIGTGKGYSIRELHARVEQITGRRIPLLEGAPRAGDPAVLCACPDRLISELGWHPEHSDLDQILQSAWMWQIRSKSAQFSARQVPTA